MAELMNPNQGEKFEVFFDAQCPLCKKEIDMVRRMDVNNRLTLTDIAHENLDPQTVGKPLDTLMREIHGRHDDGSWVVGVEVFREIYGRVGFGKLTALSRWPIVRSILNVGYSCFAWPRYKLAVRRMKKAATHSAVNSDTNHCDSVGSTTSCSQIRNAASVSDSVSSASAD